MHRVDVVPTPSRPGPRGATVVRAIALAAILGAVVAVVVLRAPARSGDEGPAAAPADAAGGVRRTWHVSPSGDDDNDGASPTAPLRTIQKALDEAAPGSVVELAPGAYRQDVRTRRNGREADPITLTGPRSAVVQGAGGGHVFEVNHDYHVLRGFTIDGLVGPADEGDGYRSKLLWVQGTRRGEGVTGLRVDRMVIQNALGECVRLRYPAVANAIGHTSIGNCGLEDFAFGGGGKNGEGIYVGTAPEQTDNGVNPGDDVDRSSRNRIHDTVIDTNGGECVDIKEGATANVVEANSCTGQRDADSGGFDVRGNGNVLRRNTIFGNTGPGIRLGGDGPDDGTGNDVYDNSIRDNRGGGVKFVRAPQGTVCGNSMSGNGRDSVGDLAARFTPARACA
ncbi:MAG TPA: right-handed parallel beta-helix repeat-containing protein [Acidimicrobiales bacterium]|nr:right-handed parallel beta-helix repeat-containing protein [Acidimicrobiales bacterium]